MATETMVKHVEHGKFVRRAFPGTAGQFAQQRSNPDQKRTAPEQKEARQSALRPFLSHLVGTVFGNLPGGSRESALDHSQKAEKGPHTYPPVRALPLVSP